jgi:cycloeucalenol cycloisomerase
MKAQVSKSAKVAKPAKVDHGWWSANPSKRAGERFFLWYTPIWIGGVAAVVATEKYKEWSDWGYNLLGLAVCLPCMLWPIFFPAKEDKNIHWTQRYATKANLWILLFNFVGNYFWTHYFFSLLGASYTFPVTIMLNKIPPVMFMLTQAYFQTYHILSNFGIRALKRKLSPGFARVVMIALYVFLSSTFVAFMETWTIQSVPYYNFPDRTRMYQIGTFFYAIYFYVSFPMFFRLDENAGENWDLSKTAIDSLGSAMTVFIFCDFWRLTVGNINSDLPADKIPFITQ